MAHCYSKIENIQMISSYSLKTCDRHLHFETATE